MKQRIDELKWENISYLYTFYFIPPAVISPSYECVIRRRGCYHIPKTYTTGVVWEDMRCKMKYFSAISCVPNLGYIFSQSKYRIPSRYALYNSVYTHYFYAYLWEYVILYTRTHKKKFDYEFSFDIKNYLFYS